MLQEVLLRESVFLRNSSHPPCPVDVTGWSFHLPGTRKCHVRFSLCNNNSKIFFFEAAVRLSVPQNPLSHEAHDHKLPKYNNSGHIFLEPKTSDRFGTNHWTVTPVLQLGDSCWGHLP